MTLQEEKTKEREKNTNIFTILIKSSVFVSYFYLREITEHFSLSLALSLSLFLSSSFLFSAANIFLRLFFLFVLLLDLTVL